MRKITKILSIFTYYRNNREKYLERSKKEYLEKTIDHEYKYRSKHATLHKESSIENKIAT